MQNEFRIGEVAARTGVSIDTVRFYERRNLLPKAPRTARGYRVFGEDAVERVLFIKQAQDLGFSLSEIGILLAKTGRGGCRNVHDLLSKKLAELDERMKRMRKFRQTLAHYLSECEVELSRNGESANCPVVEEIAHTDVTTS